MKIFRNVLLVCAIIQISISCKNERIKFEPADKRQVQYIEVADEDEVALLEQELGLEVKMVVGNRLYYYVKGNDQEQKLKDIGYGIKEGDPMKVNYQVVQLSVNDKAPDTSKAEELKKHDIQLINKEENYWVVRGPLDQLNEIQKMGYKLRIETKEPRPRQVEIMVKSKEDIQKVNELEVDIYSYQKSDKERSITIYAGAFDYQIEQMQRMGYIVILK
jgi:hypothetical protein